MSHHYAEGEDDTWSAADRRRLESQQRTTLQEAVLRAAVAYRNACAEPSGRSIMRAEKEMLNAVDALLAAEPARGEVK